MSDSPVWKVEEWDLTLDLAKIEQQWTYLRDLLEDQALYDLRNPEISGWSCGEHAGHIAMVTKWIATGIEQNLREPDRDAGEAWAEHTEWVLSEGDFPRGAAEAPQELDPVDRKREDFITTLSAAQLGWTAVAQKVDLLGSCAARFPHFALGYMTSAEWVRFCALHTAHHLAVVRDIRAGAAQPGDHPGSRPRR